MKLEMSFDEAQVTAIESGLLSPEEIERLKSSLREMRRLADKKPYTREDEKEMQRLRYIFDDLAVKGMPQLEHLRPQPENKWLTTTVPLVGGIILAIVILYFSDAGNA